MNASATIAGPAIATEHLTRRFGDLVAVQDVNLRVASGQFFGFLGPNGAGKSTTIKMLTGLLAPTSGRMQILGIDLTQDSVEVKRQIGVVPEGMALFGRLTGSEYLNFVGRMYGLDRATAAKRTAELLDFMQLVDQPKALVTDYSHGMQKKLALAAAVIHGPKILFLDEPFEGVDAIASNTLKSMLQNMIARGATIFLTSHVLEIVERLCSHVAIIHRGQLVAQGSLEELRAGVEAQAAAALTAAGAPREIGSRLSSRSRRKAHSRTDFPPHRRRHSPRRPGTLVAGLIFSPEIRGQFAAIARVRWQLFVNSLRTIRGRLEVVARVFHVLWFRHGRDRRVRRARRRRVVFRFQWKSGMAPRAPLARLPVLATFSRDGQRLHRKLGFLELAALSALRFLPIFSFASPTDRSTLPR